VAKRGRRRGGADAASIETGPDAAGGFGSGQASVSGGEGANAREDTLADFAEDLGRLLGTAQSKATAWLDQRKSIADQLTQIRDTANRYLQDLAGAGANMSAAVNRGRRGRPPGRPSAKRGPGRPKGSAKKRTMSAEARARISEAQRKRWAKQRKASDT
jgi:hypothetical protein